MIRAIPITVKFPQYNLLTRLKEREVSIKRTECISAEILPISCSVMLKAFAYKKFIKNAAPEANIAIALPNRALSKSNFTAQKIT